MKLLKIQRRDSHQPQRLLKVPFVYEYCQRKSLGHQNFCL